MKKLPILVSVPHGGWKIPAELQEQCALTKHDIFWDNDGFARELYALSNYAEGFVSASIARAFVDLNRAPNDLPPQNPDGVIKTIIVNGAPVYKQNRFPSPQTIQLLLKKYYFFYHQTLEKLQKKSGLELGLDCHTMAAKAPCASPGMGQKPGQERPLFCLSNRGDSKGAIRSEEGSITCSAELLQCLAKGIRKAFGLTTKQVRLNNPFLGGYIIQAHSQQGFPWIQLEMNRSLYISKKFFDEKTLVPNTSHLEELREKVLKAIRFTLDSR